jgi:hypothetical protein
MCAILIVLFGASKAADGLSNHMTKNIRMEHFMYFLQIFNAFTSAAGSISMR